MLDAQTDSQAIHLPQTVPADPQEQVEEDGCEDQLDRLSHRLPISCDVVQRLTRESEAEKRVLGCI